MTDPRLVAASRVEEDAQYEVGLRPRLLDDYIGQDRVRENLQVAIQAARNRGEALDHVLAEDRLRERQRVVLGGEGRHAGAEDRVLAADHALARLPAFQVQLDLRQEAGARLVDGRAVGAKFGLRRPVLRVALQRELVGLEQRLGAGKGRQQAGQGRDNPEPDLGRPARRNGDASTVRHDQPSDCHCALQQGAPKNERRSLSEELRLK